MQPPNPSFSDHYCFQPLQPPSLYYSHFPPQNPNPYPLHPHRHIHLPIEPPQLSSVAVNPDPPASDSYFSSYSFASGAYNSHHASGVTYPQTIGVAPAPPPPPVYASDSLVQHWVAEEHTQQFANSLYATGGSLSQDGLHPPLAPIPTPSTWTNPMTQPRGPWKKIPKKTKIAQSAWCEICKIECNTKDILYQHKLGKKHLKNLEKLYAPAPTAAATGLQLYAPVSAAATTHINTGVRINQPVIGPMENPRINPALKKKKLETPQDLEIKRRKVVEGGAAVSAVRTCRICNVVCNSDTVFRFHLAGQKHNSMIKKSQ